VCRLVRRVDVKKKWQNLPVITTSLGKSSGAQLVFGLIHRTRNAGFRKKKKQSESVQKAYKADAVVRERRTQDRARNSRAVVRERRTHRPRRLKKPVRLRPTTLMDRHFRHQAHGHQARALWFQIPILEINNLEQISTSSVHSRTFPVPWEHEPSLGESNGQSQWLMLVTTAYIYIEKQGY
jgi:hypothetical protein